MSFPPRRIYDDEDEGVLDEGILDATSLDAADLFSPKYGHHDWTNGHGHENTAATMMMSGGSGMMAPNPFLRSAGMGNPFGLEASVRQWSAGTCAPTAAQPPMAAAAAAATAVENTPLEEQSDTKPPRDMSEGADLSLSSSPQSSKDWNSGDTSTSNTTPTTTTATTTPSMSRRNHNPMHSQSLSVLRRDGIRKKNARFDIPAERSLLNIDSLIAQSANDQEVKELKQQKRLLRNRQAALDSRQRKKLHTERLEEEKKQFTTIIQDLQDRLNQTRLTESHFYHRESEWKLQQQQYEHYIKGLQLEKEEMIRCHTLETGDLRKKNAVLTEHLQQNYPKLETATPTPTASTAMSAVPSSSGYSADFSDVDSLTAAGGGDGAWDHFPYLRDYPDPGESAVVQREKHQANDNKPAAGLLLVLLLCGALVASKTSSSSSPPQIPRMPDEVRQASATVLRNMFQDAGVHSAQPTATYTSWPSTSPAADTGRLGLDASLNALLHPSKLQEEQQLFSLTPEQYNTATEDLLPHDFSPGPSSSAHHGMVGSVRHDLTASLAAMRNGGGKSSAEVYTRSLLWDKVPTEVVREFARFVAANEIKTEHD